MNVDKSTRDWLLEIHRKKRLMLEGNLLKVIDPDPTDEEFTLYIKDAIEKDKEVRRKRLDITKQVQSQNIELIKWKEENEKIQSELKDSLQTVECSMAEVQSAMIDAQKAREESLIAKEEAEEAREEAEKSKEAALKAKETAENDLELVQKRTQFELIGSIVKVALFVILGVGVVTTGMYIASLAMGKDTSVIGSTWSNIIGILLTNSFSIVGTIMGVKYASERKEKKE